MLVLLASVNITNRFEKSDLRALYHHSQASNGRVISDCITLCDIVAAFCFVHGKVKRCQKIKIPMCKDIGYNLTYTPNMLNHATQEEAALEVAQFWPLLEFESKLFNRLKSLSLLYECSEVRAA